MLYEDPNMIDPSRTRAIPDHPKMYNQTPPPDDLVEHVRNKLSTTPPPRQDSRPTLTIDTSFVSSSSSDNTPSPPPSYDAATDLNQLTLQVPTEQKITAPRPTPVSAEPEPRFAPLPEAALSAPELPGIPDPEQRVTPLFSRNSNSIPLHHLNMAAAIVDCPICDNRAMTRTKKNIGNTQHAWAIGATALTGVLGFIPYFMQSLRDVQHFCSSCDSHLVNWHKSGTVEVLAHGVI